MGFTKRKGGLVSGLARSTFLLVEKGELKSLVHRLFVSLLAYTPQLRVSKQSKKQSHDRAMPYSNNRILMMRIIGIIEDQ